MKLLVLDCDGTLYDSRELEKQWQECFFAYFCPLFGNTREELEVWLPTLLAKYHTRSATYAVSRELNVAFSESVMNTYSRIEVSCIVGSCNDLQGLINRLPMTKIVMTNSPALFASRVLSTLGILDCFNRMLTIEDMAFSGKPLDQAFASVQEMFPDHEKSRPS